MPGHLTLDQSKKNSRYLEFLEQIFGTLEQYSLVVSNFPKISKTFYNFCSQISLFSTPAGTTTAIVSAKMIKDWQIDFFSLFIIEYFDSIFWSLEYFQ